MNKEKNLELWESVEKTDPKHTREVNVKGNKITSIRPQYQIYQATKKWGSYGDKWGLRNIELTYDLKDMGLVNFKAKFYYPSGIERNNPEASFEIINTISIWRDNAKTKLDDEFAKKVETDTLTKALSKLGFNADIFMGRFEDQRYVNEMNEFFNPKIKITKEQAIKIIKTIDSLENLNRYYKDNASSFNNNDDMIEVFKQRKKEIENL